MPGDMRIIIMQYEDNNHKISHQFDLNRISRMRERSESMLIFWITRQETLCWSSRWLSSSSLLLLLYLRHLECLSPLSACQATTKREEINYNKSAFIWQWAMNSDAELFSPSSPPRLVSGPVQTSICDLLRVCINFYKLSDYWCLAKNTKAAFNCNQINRSPP